MIKAWDIVTQILLKTAEHVKPGVSTFTLNAIATQEMKRLGAVSFNKGYQTDHALIPFPSETCISVNDEIAHGIPSYERILQDGDLVNIDIGIIAKDGQCGDAALSVPVGTISQEDEILLRYAKKCLFAGIKKIRNGVTVEEIARAIDVCALERNLKVNRQLSGHGIGTKMHEEPFIYHTGNWYIQNQEDNLRYQKYLDQELKTGMIVCIEPCITFSDPYGYFDPKNGWIVRTRDGKKGAMFEHMVRVLDDGYEILTDHIKAYPETQPTYNRLEL